MRWRLHLPLYILAILFALPPIGAFVVLHYKEQININTTQHGQFADPPIQIALNKARILAGETMQNKWIIVSVDHANHKPLDQQEMLLKVHTALGEKRERVTIASVNAVDLNPELQFTSHLILNPQQMCVMHFTNPDYAGLLKDIRKFLKYSHV